MRWFHQEDQGGAGVFDLHSPMEGILWPAIPPPRDAAQLALQFQLEQSQWWPPETILEHQLRQAGALLDHARKNVPYYRRLFKGLRLKEGKPPTAKQWARLPILRREDIQAAGRNLHTRGLPKSHGKAGETFTSGSTSTLIRTLHSDLSGLFFRGFTFRDHLWQRRDLSKKAAVIRMLGKDQRDGKGVTLNTWSPIRALKTGPCAGLDITIPVAQQAKWLKRQNPDYLLTYPTNALHLARHCLEKGIKFKNLREVETLSESLTPEIRAACRAAWGVKVVDIYSAQETGCLALQCPEYEHYHVQAEGVLLEVLDDEGRPCNPGEVGRVVVTPLHNFAMPLIRYEIGDYARLGPPCPCGRGLPVLQEIIGRIRNMLVLPDGGRVYPIFATGDFLSVAPIKRKQIVQTGPGEIEVKIVADNPLTADQEAMLANLLNEGIGHAFNYTFTYPDDLPRSEGGKFEEVRVDYKPDDGAA